MKSRLERTALLLAGAVMLIGLGSWWLLGRAKDARPAVAQVPIPVVVGRVVRQDVPHTTTAVGTVQSLHTVNVRSQVDGVLEQVLFQEGQVVKEGDLLARIDDRAIVAALEQARAEKERNEALLKAAQIDLQRYERLAKDQTIARQSVDQQTAQVDQLKAAIAAAQASIAAAEVQLSYTRIGSPVNGRTGLRHVDPGNLVRSSDAQGLVTVTQLDPIAVVFSLPQDLLPEVQRLMGQPEPARVDAFDRDGGTRLAQGRLTLMDNQIDTRTGTIELKAEFPNADGRLWPGQFVSVELLTGISRHALVVSASAVQHGREYLYVYRLDGAKVAAVPITLSFENDDLAVIESGLKPGDVVITEGQSRLRPGAAVTVTRSQPSPQSVAKEGPDDR